MTISIVDVGYIAGLFDGEGSLHIKRAPEKKRNIKVNLDIGCLIPCVLVWR